MQSFQGVPSSRRETTAGIEQEALPRKQTSQVLVPEPTHADEGDRSIDQPLFFSFFFLFTIFIIYDLFPSLVDPTGAS